MGPVLVVNPREPCLSVLQHLFQVFRLHSVAEILSTFKDGSASFKG